MRGGRALAAALALAALLAAGAAPARETVSLRLRPQKGKVYQRRINFTQNISLGGKGQQQFIRRSLGLALVFRVAEVDASGALIEGTYRSVFFVQSDLKGTVTWDSENPGAQVPRPIQGLAPLVGKTFRIKVSPDGRLLEIEGVSDETVRSIMSLYPDAPVGIGDSWQRQLDLGKGTGVLLDGTITLRERRGGTLFLDLSSTMRQATGAINLDLGSVALGYGVTGTCAGPLEVEESSGWLVRARLTYRFDGQVEVGNIPQLPVRLSLPFSGEGKVEMEPF